MRTNILLPRMLLGFCCITLLLLTAGCDRVITEYKANRGDAESQFRMGMYYSDGKEYEADDWFHKAAEQGYADAQYQIGEKLAKEKSFLDALRYFQYAEEQEKKDPQHSWFGRKPSERVTDMLYELGCQYADGSTSYMRDMTKAVSYFQQAAVRGRNPAIFRLALCYMNGDGIPMDKKMAFSLFQILAEIEGVWEEAKYNLAICYLNGWGVAKNTKKAFYWFQKAADLRCVDAQNALGWCYENGSGVARDMSAAQYWYQKAADQGNEKARKNLSRLNGN